MLTISSSSFPKGSEMGVREGKEKTEILRDGYIHIL
jgi:hypothetical protein